MKYEVRRSIEERLGKLEAETCSAERVEWLGEWLESRIRDLESTILHLKTRLACTEESLKRQNNEDIGDTNA